MVSFQANKCGVLQAFDTSYFRNITADGSDSFCVKFQRNKGVKMGHGLLLISLFIAATGKGHHFTLLIALKGNVDLCVYRVSTINTV